LLSVGVVDEPAPPREEVAATPIIEHAAPLPDVTATVSEGEIPGAPAASVIDAAAEEPSQRGGRKRGRRATPSSVERQAASSMPAPAAEAPPLSAPSAPSPRKTRARTAAKTAHRRARAKKSTPKTEN
jgi:hypothetical protein